MVWAAVCRKENRRCFWGSNVFSMYKNPFMETFLFLSSSFLLFALSYMEVNISCIVFATEKIQAKIIIRKP